MKRILFLAGAVALFCSNALPAFAQKAAPEEAVSTESEHEPFVRNWWQWNYVDEHGVHHPPFGFSLINFAVFLFVMNRFVGKQFRQFVKERHTQIRAAMEEAALRKQKAMLAQQQIQTQMAQVAALQQEWANTLQQQMDEERARRHDLLQTRIRRLEQEVSRQVDLERKQARLVLAQSATQAVTAQAEALLRAQLQPSDKQRILLDTLVSFEKGAKTLTHDLQTGRRA